jgi:hypothetical protein
MNEALVLLGSGLSGFAVGTFYGFFAAARSTSNSGYIAPDDRPLLKLLTGVNLQLTFVQALALLLLMAFSAVLFLGCIGVPAVLASRLAPEWGNGTLLGYGVLFTFSAVGWRFGEHVWRVVS